VNAAPLRCSIFCAIVDNFGDIGVCWRLARQLVREHGVDVTLWVDDPELAAAFVQHPVADVLTSGIEGVRVASWASSEPLSAVDIVNIASSDLLIEAFACALPDALLAALGSQASVPIWINLEYLSAQTWVDDHHLLASLLTLPGQQDCACVIAKTFFFPGFTPRTGGLLREAGVLERHALWQQQEAGARRQLLDGFAPGLAASLRVEAVLVSLFTYESASMQGCLNAMAQDSVPTVCLVPEGRALAGVQAFLGQATCLRPGDVRAREALTIVVIPFQSQDNYDLLLSLCDFNFVRGEDSFVRAQWAARPLLWHIYPQQEQAHLEKLDAFLALQDAESGGGDDPQAAGGMALRQFVRFWNQGEDCAELWHHLRPQLPGLRKQARKWQEYLAEMPDLAANLLRFCRSKSR